MAYFPDLSPYTYFNLPGLINVGWLDAEHPFTTGTVEPEIVARIGRLCASPSLDTMGRHPCPWCEQYVLEDYNGDGNCQPMGSSEIRVSSGGRTYAAPDLVYHYIVRHHYLPPQEFLDAVERWIE